MVIGGCLYLVGNMRSITTRNLRQSIKNKILERDLICVYCGGYPTQVDHVVPWSYSRCDDEDNLVASCQLCNQIAYNFMFNDFDAKRAYILKKRGMYKYSVRIAREEAVCNSCGHYFHPGINGAKRFTCADCIDLVYKPKKKRKTV